MSAIDKKRIAKNTMMLYIRMILITLVTLYTSRIVLEMLGVEDFGIYNVVGGIVVMLGFLNSAMTTATQRFLSYEIGCGNSEGSKKVFGVSITIHTLIVAVVFIFAELIGVWFLNHKMVIPPERIAAANWVLQFSILTFCVNIIIVPYRALIISYEKMSAFAYISIFEAIIKLSVAFILKFIVFDKLEAYSCLIFIVALLLFLSYKFYCVRQFAWSKFRFIWDRVLIEKMLSFCGWSMLGGFANVCSNQGINIIINIFYGVVVNAAMGIANQVSAALYQFVSSFQTAFNPQIIKSYASNDQRGFINLIIKTSKYSVLLQYLISLPIIIHTEDIINLWLGEVPPYSVVLCRWWIIFNLLDAIQGPLWVSVQATGKIRMYQIIVCILILMNIPLTILTSRLGMPPQYALISKVAMNGITFIYRLVYLNNEIALPVVHYIRELFYNVVTVVLIAAVCAYYISIYLNEYWILSIFIILILTTILSFVLGLTKTEKSMVVIFIKSKIASKL